MNQLKISNQKHTENFRDKTREKNLVKMNDRLQVNGEQLSSNDKIKIVQKGDEICINIGDNIEILTNITNDRKVISLSPQVNRKVSNRKTTSLPIEKSNQKSDEIIGTSFLNLILFYNFPININISN